MSIEQVFEKLETAFLPEAFEGERVQYWFELGEGDDDSWSLSCSSDGLKVLSHERGSSVDCKVTMSEEMFVRVMTGEHKPGAMDFVRGKIKTDNLDLFKRFGKSFRKKS